jgi:hypothetical protein
MGIRKQMLKGVGQAVAPRLTRAALNPRKTAFKAATSWALDRTAGRRRQSARNLGMIGVGAAVLALPLGIWIGRRISRSGENG